MTGVKVLVGGNDIDKSVLQSAKMLKTRGGGCLKQIGFVKVDDIDCFSLGLVGWGMTRWQSRLLPRSMQLLL